MYGFKFIVIIFFGYNNTSYEFDVIDLWLLLHCQNRIQIPTRIRREFPVGTIVSFQMFTLQ